VGMEPIAVWCLLGGLTRDKRKGSCCSLLKKGECGALTKISTVLQICVEGCSLGSHEYSDQLPADRSARPSQNRKAKIQKKKVDQRARA
jgi:hypothetical protein